ncbi:hypothetical protein [Flavivirga rizhaonensis]|uniref:DUF1761 domain-containing protein n=1 Tax=Flavivirga rizhaonensis TaxID=2559571 RepID=A0A4S1E0Z1_9FLAO|nr:hypothetical protein [Flavivirga rizhaonensis]TGV04159.1 hypothetical protein EM932_03200 [Flavivirga rizhaonensis]
MFSKTNLISTIITTIWGFLGGWLLWGIIGDPMLADHTVSSGLMKEVPDMALLTIGCLVVGFAFSTMYSKWARGSHGIFQGVQFGIWIGILIGLGSGLIDYSTSNLLDLSGTIINAAIYIVHYSIMGILASLIYGKSTVEG